MKEDRAKENTASVDRPIELSIRPASPAFDSPDSLLEDAASWPHPPDGRDGCPAMTGSDHNEITSSSPPLPATMTYTVRRGDTLSRIALHRLGDANRYREIFAANRDQLSSVNARLKVGMILRIPGTHAGRSTASKTKTPRSNNSSSTVPKTRQVPAQPVLRGAAKRRASSRVTPADRRLRPTTTKFSSQPGSCASCPCSAAPSCGCAATRAPRTGAVAIFRNGRQPRASSLDGETSIHRTGRRVRRPRRKTRKTATLRRWDPTAAKTPERVRSRARLTRSHVQAAPVRSAPRPAVRHRPHPRWARPPRERRPRHRAPAR